MGVPSFGVFPDRGGLLECEWFSVAAISEQTGCQRDASIGTSNQEAIIRTGWGGVDNRFQMTKQAETTATIVRERGGSSQEWPVDDLLGLKAMEPAAILRVCFFPKSRA